MVVMFVGQRMHETGSIFGTYHALVDTNFMRRGVVMPQYPVCMAHKGLAPCTGITVWFSGAWQSFDVDEVEEVQVVNIFQNHGVAWEQRVDQYDAMVDFMMTSIFRIQDRNPLILRKPILVHFNGVGTLPALLLITFYAHLLDSVTLRVRLKPVKRWK
jgi:hypothetical protein